MVELTMKKEHKENGDEEEEKTRRRRRDIQYDNYDLFVQKKI